MATRLSYPHANLGYVTVAELVKHAPRFGGRRKNNFSIGEAHLSQQVILPTSTQCGPTILNSKIP